MSCLDCCSSIAACDCCCSVMPCDCCSVDCGCCPDCFGAGSWFGGIKLGDGLVLDGDTLKVTISGGSECTCQPYVLPTATESIKGGVKVGHSLMMNGEGDEVMNVALDTVSSTVEGFMWINDVAQSVTSGDFTQEDVDDVFG